MSAGFFIPPVMTAQPISFRPLSCQAFLSGIRIRLHFGDFAKIVNEQSESYSKHGRTATIWDNLRISRTSRPCRSAEFPDELGLPNAGLHPEGARRLARTPDRERPGDALKPIAPARG